MTFMSIQTYDDVVATVADTIRSTIDEDWIEEFEINPETRFSEDLEIESIEFVKIADALMTRFGDKVDIVGWLSGKSIHELINLNVGDIAGYVAERLSVT